MATVKVTKSHDGELAININDVLTTVFGTYDEPKDDQQVADAIAGLLADNKIDELNGLYTILSLREIEVSKQLKRAQDALLSAMDRGNIAQKYGKIDPLIGVCDHEGTPLGEIDFSSVTKEVSNSETSKKVPEDVKAELHNLGLDSQYIDVTERLNNAKIKEAKKAGTLPPTIDSMITLSSKTTNGVSFKGVPPKPQK